MVADIGIDRRCNRRGNVVARRAEVGRERVSAIDLDLICVDGCPCSDATAGLLTFEPVALQSERFAAGRTEGDGDLLTGVDPGLSAHAFA